MLCTKSGLYALINAVQVNKILLIMLSPVVCLFQFFESLVSLNIDLTLRPATYHNVQYCTWCYTEHAEYHILIWR